MSKKIIRGVQKTGQVSKKLDGILGIFYENPNVDFSVREIEKKTDISKSTISNYLKRLRANGVLDEDCLGFKIRKTNYFIEKIVASNVLEEIVEKLNPSCVILFGSVRKGDYDKDSDVDLFVESSVKKKLDLSKFEKKLGHRIELFVESDIKKLPKNLLNNVVNGIKLFGAFRIK